MPFSTRCRGGCGRRAPRPRRPPRPASGTTGGRGRGRSARRGGSRPPRPARVGRSSSTQTASECPTITGTRTHVAEIGRSGSSRILRVSARSFASSSDSSPSQRPVHHEVVRPSGGSCASASIRCAPAPETDWYVETRTARAPPPRGGACRTQVSGIVQQFGFATIRSRSSASSARFAVDLRARRAGSRRPGGTRTTCRCRSRPRRRRRDELAARRRADREEEQVDVAGAERLGRRLLDDELAVAERTRVEPAERGGGERAHVARSRARRASRASPCRPRRSRRRRRSRGCAAHAALLSSRSRGRPCAPVRPAGGRRGRGRASPRRRTRDRRRPGGRSRAASRVTRSRRRSAR